MKKILIALMALTLAACQSVSTADLTPKKEPIETRLLNLTPTVNVLNVESTYRSWRGRKVDANVLSNAHHADVGKVSTKNLRASDTLQIFRKEVLDNIVQNEGKTRGTIQLTLRDRKSDGSFTLKFFSWMTLCSINLVGFPKDLIEDTLEIEVDILNNKGDVVKSYRETVESSTIVAMYYGYSKAGAFRKDAVDNTKKGLEIIRKRIAKDAVEINKKLAAQ